MFASGFVCFVLMLGVRLVSGQRTPPPTVTILSPADNERFRFDATIDLDAFATDDDDGTLTGNAIEWFLDGNSIGNGNQLTFPASFFNVAYHTLRAVATNSDGVKGSAEVTILIFAPQCPEELTHSDADFHVVHNDEGPVTAEEEELFLDVFKRLYNAMTLENCFMRKINAFDFVDGEDHDVRRLQRSPRQKRRETVRARSACKCPECHYLHCYFADQEDATRRRQQEYLVSADGLEIRQLQQERDPFLDDCICKNVTEVPDPSFTLPDLGTFVNRLNVVLDTLGMDTVSGLEPATSAVGERCGRAQFVQYCTDMYGANGQAACMF